MGSLKEVQNMVLLYLEEQIIEDEEFRLMYEDYRKVMESYYFWTADKDMKMNVIFFNLSGWKRTGKIQAWPGIEPWPLWWLDAMLYPLI